MSEKIIRPGIVSRITELTKSRNQVYTSETVDNILTAFFDVIEDAISNGTSIVWKGYMKIEPQYRVARKIRHITQDKNVIVPPHYRVHIKSGAKLNRAAEEYTKNQLYNSED